MTVYRICQARYALPLTGEGARRFGGRWNHPDTAVVYTSGSIALAMLEILVHLGEPALPKDFVRLTIHLPDIEIEQLNNSLLPPDWRTYPGTSILKDLGTAWAASGRGLALGVPSAIVPEESNVLLNPLHPDFHRIRVEDPVPFTFDERLAR